MLELFTVEVLAAGDAAASYALARMGRPDLSLPAWKKWIIKGQPPIAAVRVPGSTYVALFTREKDGIAPISVAQLPGIPADDLKRLAGERI